MNKCCLVSVKFLDTLCETTHKDYIQETSVCIFPPQSPALLLAFSAFRLDSPIQFGAQFVPHLNDSDLNSNSEIAFLYFH